MITAKEARFKAVEDEIFSISEKIESEAKSGKRSTSYTVYGGDVGIVMQVLKDYGYEVDVITRTIQIYW